MSFAPGDRVLDRYVIESELGKGGMGMVYLAKHATLGMPVAVKLLLVADEGFRARFGREAALMARVRHPNVVTVLDYGFSDSKEPMIVMEFVEGETVKERLARRQSLPWPEAVSLVKDVLRGLEAIHAAGVIHRDLKPDNIAIAALDPEVAKLLDFGIARAADAGSGDANLTATGMVVGTPMYMAPEQLLGGVLDKGVDVYAAALILYELIAGEPPLSGGDTQPMIRRLRETIPPPIPRQREAGELPEVLVAALMASLDVKPNVRPSARALREALEQSLSLTTGVQYAAAQGATADEHLVDRPHTLVDNAQPAATGAAPHTPTGGTQTSYLIPPVLAPPPGATSVQAQQANPPSQFTTTVSQKGLLVASLPPSRLTHAQERQWLAELAQPGRGFTLGSQIWFTVQAARGGSLISERLERLEGAIRERFGSSARVASSPVGADFKLTAAQLTGASPLPETALDLIEKVSLPSKEAH